MHLAHIGAKTGEPSPFSHGCTLPGGVPMPGVPLIKINDLIRQLSHDASRACFRDARPNKLPGLERRIVNLARMFSCYFEPRQSSEREKI